MSEQYRAAELDRLYLKRAQLLAAIRSLEAYDRVTRRRLKRGCRPAQPRRAR
jgi:hypothetical protein